MEEMVDAIEEGRIIRVSKTYAIREGLVILRKPEVPKADTSIVKQQMKISPRLRGDRKIYADLDRFRRPLRDKNEIKSSLVENFNWILSSKRKSLNFNRRQVAQATGVSEEDIKSLELGLLPHHDFIAISKLESYYGVNLRKNPNDIRMAPRSDIKPAIPSKEDKEEISRHADDLISNSIEIDDSEI